MKISTGKELYGEKYTTYMRTEFFPSRRLKIVQFSDIVHHKVSRIDIIVIIVIKHICHVWWHISAITCQIIMSTCQIFMLTCQLFMMTCQIIMLTCQKNITTTSS